ncbi:hypothetical protein PR202_gb09551 [Eleusine coracana subsp. coracana]|uniref:Uncharacterized protein n=1 Tax=Eleusine coracana subsp. coracana TaxID=191504 RepID=A0AAV5EGW1_ELECO|nr:hypothetical protein PR202_gb09551 [Eleusine coracana subsp. coracana]
MRRASRAAGSTHHDARATALDDPLLPSSDRRRRLAEMGMDARRFASRVAAALAAARSMPLPVRITNGLAMISLVLSSCDLLRLCSDPDRALRFPLGGREAATVLCQLASVVYLLCLLGVPFAHPSSEPRAASSPRRRAPPQPMHDAAEVGDEEIVAAGGVRGPSVVPPGVPPRELPPARRGCGGRRSGE